MDRATQLASVCALLADGEVGAAKASLDAHYPRASVSTPRRSWTLKRLMAVFLRDGFTDRYSGVRLVFPGTLRALSILMPNEFPYHPNWKHSATHPAFWEMYPTIDHVVPVARGGADDESNAVTTSMLRNAAKANWLLEELGWPAELEPIARDWDGLLAWFMSSWDRHESLRQDMSLRRWHRAASAALA